MSVSVPRAFATGVGAGVLILLALLAAATVVVPALAGASTYTITGRSMEPALPLGTLIVTREAEPVDIGPGDVITFQLEPGSPAVATHRVAGLAFSGDGSRSFITQGDNNAEADTAPVIEEQLKGRLWYAVPWVGWITAIVDAQVRAWLVPLAAGVLLAYGVWMVVAGVRERLNTAARRREQAQEQSETPDH